METEVYNQEGQMAGKIELPDSVFGLPWNDDLVHQVIVSMQSNKRTPVAHTKNRGEVSGTGRKPWRQKGTGRARHGSRRSPIWIGGGVAHGPRNDRNFTKKINVKMMKKAFYTILSQKYRDDELLFVDKIALKERKTREAGKILKNLSRIEDFEKLSTKVKNKAILVLPKKEEKVERSFRNIEGMRVLEARNLNPLEILTYKYLILGNPHETLKILEK